MDNLFGSIFISGESITISNFMISMGVAILIGIFMAKMFMYKSKCSKGFVSTLALLPVGIAMVIIMVNGNIGAGVAVAGAFSLVRFRSVPGTAREIGAVFTAMGAGLTIGMGYVAYAAVFTVISCVFALILDIVNFGENKEETKILRITIPESLNYTDVFDDLFEKYTDRSELNSVKTTNMGSLFKLTYEIEMKNISKEKEFIDDIRCRNGNLDIVITKPDTSGIGL